MNFYIDYVVAIAQGKNNILDFKDISYSEMINQDIKIDTSVITPAMRRRCSKSSKIALSVSIPQIHKHKIDAVVFASQHGELANTISIFKNISNQEILSPNAFSQSVHNTPTGLMSIQQKLKIPFNSISAGTETFEMALIDAVAQLQDYDNVLLTCYDDNVPEIFEELNITDNLAYGVSFIISKTPISDSSLALKLKTNSKKSPSQKFAIHPSAIIFINWYTNKKRESLLFPNISIELSN
ncbi:beta-ketoacyl synthase chain length factor [Francisella sp. SYW-9]|uniref:beta-ketoacyl synthase chain length factor n=1 Tax=Francisella sp. SYW-9 TaxID=2610888 RepID=UPI00123C8AFD|nr:beta-ketoacyl synthase chain length factor [Francisella sp. SYW-9]